MEFTASKYERQGVSASKSEVHEAIKHLDKGLFPMAFCKILPDVVGDDPAYCNIMHADTAGTKTSLAYLYWKETGADWVWRSIVQDAIVMNIDDMACVGCIDNIVLSSTIGRNKNLISGAAIAGLIRGTSEFLDGMRVFGINIYLAGGETADVGDIVRTLDVGFTTFARMERKDLIINNIKSGDAIVGLASDGMASYETRHNSGIGSNGLTAARHDVLSSFYAQNHKDAYDPNTPEDVVFTGPYRLTDPFPGRDNLDVGGALLSPTRSYLPILKEIYQSLHGKIHGVIHCTGGGQTKVLKFVKQKHIIKDNLMEIPPVFKLIQESSGTHWKEMYQVFNMGHRLELYVDPVDADAIVEVASKYDIKAQIIGHVEDTSRENKLTIQSSVGTFTY